MLLMTESGMRGGVCHVIHSYAQADNKYMNNYDENKESSFCLIEMQIICMGVQ